MQGRSGCVGAVAGRACSETMKPLFCEKENARARCSSVMPPGDAGLSVSKPTADARTARGGESEFLEALLPTGFPEDLYPLGNCGTDTLVYHNGLMPVPYKRPRRMEAVRWFQPPRPRATCGDHGWGGS